METDKGLVEMISLHKLIRDRLERKAGLVEGPKAPLPTLSEIYAAQWNRDFEAKMRNRMAMGYFRYGSLEKQIGRHKFDNVASIIYRVNEYARDRNREHLVDIANLCLVEYTVHPEHPFNPVDDGIHTPLKA